MAATPSKAGLLDRMQACLQREYGARLDDGYSVVSFRPAIAKSYWAPGDRHLAQIAPRRALFDRVVHDAGRLWLIAVNLDPRPYLRGACQVEAREAWTSPDWNRHEKHAVYGAECAPDAIDRDGLINADVAARDYHVIVVAPDRKIGLRPGSVSVPALVFASSEAELERVCKNPPDGQWF
jgi:hypothetical protein